MLCCELFNSESFLDKALSVNPAIINSRSISRDATYYTDK
jgi:hypothetical protein